MLLVGVVCGCSREDDEFNENGQHQNDMGNEGQNGDEKPIEDVRYYVKYETYMPYGGFHVTDPARKITLTTDKGTQTFSVSEAKWEGVYGPFQKGSELYLKVEAENGPVLNTVDSYVRLSVSRDKEPFVIKGEQRGRGENTLFTSYVIDF